MKRIAWRLFLVAGVAMAPGLAAIAQEPAEVNLRSLMRMDGGPGASLALTCLAEVSNPADAQLTVRMVHIRDGRSAPAAVSNFVWRGAENAGEPVQGQILLFSQSGDEIGKRGQRYLTLLSGFEGNPIQRSQTAGPVALQDGERWWSRYGSDNSRQADDPRGEMILFLMGSGEAVEANTVAELQTLSQTQKQAFVVVTLHLTAASKAK